MVELVLSVYPGIDGLGMAFEQEGYCVVRGPDPLWGGDNRRVSYPAGRFEGVIGGPPCQIHSRLRFLNPNAGRKHGDLIPDFCRTVGEAQPAWFLMENVPEAPLPGVAGYVVRPLLLNNRWLGDGVGAEQNRVRRFSFGTRDGRTLDVSPDVALFEAPLVELAVTASRAEPGPVRLQRAAGGGHVVKRRLRVPPAVLAGHGGTGQTAQEQGLTTRSLAEMNRLQGFPEDFLEEAPLTAQGKRRVIGNSVPMWMGLAIARAVKRATTTTTDEVAV